MTAWMALKAGFDAFTRRLPLLLGAWVVILICQQVIDLLMPDSLFLLQTVIMTILLAPLYAGQQFLALKVVRGEPVTFKEFSVGLQRWSPVVLGYLLVTLFTLLGALFFIIPGILVALAYAFVPICLVDTSRGRPSAGVIGAMRESSRLSRGYRGTLFGIGLLLAIPTLVLAIFLWLSASNPAIPTWVVEIIAILSGTLFLGPVQATSFMVVYDHAVSTEPVNRTDQVEGESGIL